MMTADRITDVLRASNLEFRQLEEAHHRLDAERTGARGDRRRHSELISLRYTVCCGGSMLKKNEANRCTSAGIGFNATPCAEVNNSGCWLTYAMSARRVWAQ